MPEEFEPLAQAHSSLPDETEINTKRLFGAIESSLAFVRSSLLDLARSKDESVRMIVAQDYNCPEEALWWLSEDDSVAVRREVAANPASPVIILERLMADEDETVAAMAEQERKRLLRRFKCHVLCPQGQPLVAPLTLPSKPREVG